MNTIASKINRLTIIKALLLVTICSASILSIKTAYDLAEYSFAFPFWFVPVFSLGVIGLITISLILVLKALKVPPDTPSLTGRTSVFLWVLISLSFICTTAVHRFYPFHPETNLILPFADKILKINFTIAMVGLITSTILATVYTFSRHKGYAIIALLILALLALVPNDNCANPFNFWWIDTIGASPLMYVPNLYAAIFVACGLLGINPKSTILLTFGTCVGTLLLGLGHMFRIIW